MESALFFGALKFLPPPCLDGTVPSLSPVDVPSLSPAVSSLVKVCPQFNSTQMEKAEKILEYLKSKNGSITDLMEISGEKNKNRLRQKVLYPLIGAELIEPTIKETPNYLITIRKNITFEAKK